MRRLTRICFGIILIFSICHSLHAQVPDHLEQPYWDLVKLNNARQYQAAILQGKILVAQEPNFSYSHFLLPLILSHDDSSSQIGFSFLCGSCFQIPQQTLEGRAVAVMVFPAAEVSDVPREAGRMSAAQASFASMIASSRRMGNRTVCCWRCSFSNAVSTSFSTHPLLIDCSVRMSSSLS